MPLSPAPNKSASDLSEAETIDAKADHWRARNRQRRHKLARQNVSAGRRCGKFSRAPITSAATRRRADLPAELTHVGADREASSSNPARPVHHARP